MHQPKIRCMIVDDEPLAVRVIALHLAEVSDIEIVGTYTRALEAYERLKQDQVDLLFLDINMPTLNGIDLINALEHPPRVIFTTAHREYAVEGFELDVVDYLLKPIALPRMLRAIEKYRRLVPPTEPAQASANTSADFITIRANRQNIRVTIEDILYIESLSDYVQIHTMKGVLITKERISHLEEKMVEHGFVRIHRSFLIALNRVDAYKTEELMIGEAVLPISRTYRISVTQALDDLFNND